MLPIKSITMHKIIRTHSFYLAKKIERNGSVLKIFLKEIKLPILLK